MLAVSPGCWTWRDPAGRLLLSPGPGRGEEDWQVAATPLHPAHQLGLAVRGGAEFGLGIYVTGVAPHSPAARLGLHVIYRYVRRSSNAKSNAYTFVLAVDTSEHLFGHTNVAAALAFIILVVLGSLHRLDVMAY